MQVVSVAVGMPSHSPTKQPSCCKSRKRSQSAPIWFQPACCLSRIPSSMSPTVMGRIWSIQGVLASSQKSLDQLAMNVGQAVVPALEPEGQAGVIDPKLVQDGGVEIVDVDRILDDV